LPASARGLGALDQLDPVAIGVLLPSWLFDPDVVLDLSRNIFNPGVYRGYAGLEQ
jgi:hypothetical protein